MEFCGFRLEPFTDLIWDPGEDGLSKHLAQPSLLPKAYARSFEKPKTMELEIYTQDEDVEKQEDWTIHATRDLIEKRNGTIIRNIRHKIMTMYRRLFTVIFLCNLAVAVSFATAKSRRTMDKLASACLGNLTAAIVIRQEHCVNGLFRVFSSVPKSWPLRIRRYCAKIYSLGGVHSGCALFGIFWLIWLAIGLTSEFMLAKMVRSWCHISATRLSS